MTEYETKLRDEFAKIAFAAFMNNGAYQSNPLNGHGWVNCTPADVMRESYFAADNAMEARNAK